MKTPVITVIAALVAAMSLSSAVSAAEHGFLAERHVSRGVKCDACHASMPPKADVKSDRCEGCHGSLAKVAEKTDSGDINPHASHVEEAQCLECHKGHRQPQLLCDQCHEFRGVRVP